MSTQRYPSPRAAKLLVVLTLVAASLALGAAWTHLVRTESAQARAFTDAAEAALANGDQGAAVLALERARSLAPRAPFVRAPLEARGPTDVEPAAVRASRLLTSAEWLATASVCGWAAGLAVAYLALRQRPLRGPIGALALAAGVSCAVAAGALGATDAYPLAVVRGGEAGLFLAPYATATRQASLPSGTLVIPRAEFREFRKVHAAGGVTGWVAQRNIESVARSGG